MLRSVCSIASITRAAAGRCGVVSALSTHRPEGSIAETVPPRTNALQAASYSHYPYRNETWAKLRKVSSAPSLSERAVATNAIEVYRNHLCHEFDTRWLRENCRCTSCYNHSTNQRNMLVHQFSTQEMEVAQHTSDGHNLTVEWADGHTSTYSWQWLSDNKHPGGETKAQQHLWNGAQLRNTELDYVPYSDVVNNDQGLKRLLSSLLELGIGLVRDVPVSVEATREVAERVSFIQETLFGKMWSFTSDLARGDTAYTNIALGAHTDTTYLSMPVGIQVFHCLEHHGDGGETLLVDGFQAAEQLRQDKPDAFWRLCAHRIYHEYIESGHHVVSLDPVLKVHPVTEALEMVRYNHYDRSPISTIPQDQIAEYYQSLEELSIRMGDPDNEFWIKMEPGMMLFVDNWRVLHGREAFTGKRQVCGCYLPRDDWVGKARILGLV